MITFPYPFDSEPVNTDAWKIGEDLKVIGSVTSYAYVQPGDGSTVAATAGLAALLLEPAAALPSLTVVVPPTPEDGQVFEVSTTADISSFTVSAPVGALILGGGPFVFAQNGGASWRFREENLTWYRRY